jgi:predicted hotdog family 3-hydroxylacyl-ACP dehydratase
MRALDLVPHRDPMCFVDQLLEFTDTTAVASATFPAEHLASAGGHVLEAALVECVAQTVAANMGRRAREKGKSGMPVRGMLTSVSGFKILSRPAAGRPLRITIHELRRLGMMLMISGEITCDGETVATGKMTLYA